MFAISYSVCRLHSLSQSRAIFFLVAVCSHPLVCFTENVCVQTQWASEIGVTQAGQAEFSALVKVVNGSRVMVSVWSYTSACMCVFMCAYYIFVYVCVCVCAFGYLSV